MSAPFKKTTRVANAKPKSLTPVGTYPIEKAIPNKCNDKINEANLVYNPRIMNIPSDISRIPLANTRLFGVRKDFVRNSGTKPIQLSGEEIC